MRNTHLCCIVYLIVWTPGIKPSSRYNSINKKGDGDYNPANGNGGGLFPNVFNLATRAHVTVNATCGENEPEVYCKLVEHVRAPQCGVCNANSSDPLKRHPKEHLVDGTTRFWKSPSMEHGQQYEWVTITLDLRQVYQVAYVIVKSAISPRPANWILEHSVDGITFRPWQFYAQTDDECWTRYGIRATRGKPSYRSDSDVICTSYYSKLEPLENGEIHTSLVNGRPGANDTSAELRDFTLARFVRLRLQKIRTLNAEFMSLQPGPHDASVTRRLFYSIKDISIGGQCVCSGHASKCVQNNKHRRSQCECQHNTCGISCEHCCPLYNQVGWRAGTPQDSAECEPCQCHGHAESCRYDQGVAAARLSIDTFGRRRGGGVCVNCTAHTTGINCDHCEDKWYRPLGVLLNDPTPCQPCQCDLRGSSGLCVKDEGHGRVPGTCICHLGFGGPRCDRCSPGFRGFPNCEPCPCDPRGTDLEDCETHCNCKLNAEGKQCDRCKVGYFGLSVNNPLGCAQCFCSGVRTLCEEAHLHVESVMSPTGWLVSDLTMTQTVEPSIDEETHQLVVGDYLFSGVESYYWVAPESYRGNRLSSYGSNISYSVSWVVMRGDTSGKPTKGPNIILVGDNGVRVACGDDLYEDNNATITCQFHENSFYHLPESVQDIVTRLRRTEYHGGEVSRKQLMSVLSNIKHILFRAKFHIDQVEGGIWEATVQTGAMGGSGPPTHSVEKCLCPPGYTGLSCEACGYGYVQVHSHEPHRDAECSRCDCNGHAETCDADTGECGPCEHNTFGPQCEECKPGYYGDAATGECWKCACPLPDPGNNFSPDCELDREENSAVALDSYVCTDCPMGFAGKHCEICAPGFYGNPLEHGSTCRPCDCNGGSCDPLSGQCLGCRGNTEGWKCERCRENHYGDPAQHDCQACNCDPDGSVATTCDPSSGQCECHPGFMGRMCDRCQTGLGNVSASCLPCDCDPVGSTTQECDPVTGQCECRPGVTGPRCDRCKEHHYGFSEEGCPGCKCNPIGAYNSTCDIVTGQCVCRPHATGLSCDTCQVGYWGLSETGVGCQQCGCDPVGSFSDSCDPRTGQCSCKYGVTGQSCEKCLPGYYGFSSQGCLECKPCNKPGHMCDPDTGLCVCPPLTQGPACAQCAPNSWGFEPSKGCKPCNCDASVAVRRQCDVISGRCVCRDGYEGSQCEMCSSGFHGFPHCRRCDCHLPGTLPQHCNISGHCTCDQTGQCPCKANVGGKKCNMCKDGTFGLTAENVDGCTQCFCFGRTTHCTQAGLTWSQITSAQARTVTVEYQQSGRSSRPQEILYISTGDESIDAVNTHLNVSHKLKLIPGVLGNVQLGVTGLFDAPIYWQLPKQFLGDRVVSYGGFFHIITETKGGTTRIPRIVLSSRPLIQIQSHHGRLVLEHYPIRAPSIAGRHEVRLHESLWQDSSGASISREVLMVALQNIQQILVRASIGSDFNKVILRSVTLDTAVLAPGKPSHVANGVEMCECPLQYNSTSCQDPSIGFTRYHHNNSISSTIIIQLVGDAVPCQCNKRSSVCNIETGFCMNCADNTGGKHCEKCAEGYYGNPSKGPCLACPCPELGRNFARSCQVPASGSPQCHCREGYRGNRCDRCSYGWYGRPWQEGGSCQPCMCDPHGVISDECDEETGQCNCRLGITGRDCSVCDRRDILTNSGCISCNDSCTGKLLDDIELMAKRLEDGAGHFTSGFVPPPWKRLVEVHNNTQLLKETLNRWHQTREDAMEKLKTLGEDELKKRAKQLLNRSTKLEKKSEAFARESLEAKQSADELLAEAISRRKELDTVVANLEKYGQGKNDMMLSVETAFKEAKKLLGDIRDVDFEPVGNAAVRAHKKCTELFNQINALLVRPPGLDKLRDSIVEFDNRLNDLSFILESTAMNLLNVTKASNRNNQRLLELGSFLDQMEEMNNEIDDLAEKNDHLIVEGANLLSQAKANLQELKYIEEHFASLTKTLEEQEVLLDRLNPLYREKYVIPAQKHADKLLRRAQEIRDMFNATRHDATFALRASQAYKNIVDALEKSREAALEASKAADIADEKANPPRQDSLLQQSSIAKKDSSRLLSRAINQDAKVAKLRERLEREKEDVATLRDSVRIRAHDDNSISRDLTNLDSNTVTKTAEDALHKTQQLIKEMNKVTDFAKKVETNTTTYLQEKLKELDSDLQLNKMEDDIMGATDNVKQSDKLLTRLNLEADVQFQKFRAWNDTLAAKLQELKDKILQARHAADGIHLSLTSGSSGHCVRSYLPKKLSPSTTTSIIMSYAIDASDSDVRNASLLYLPSATTGDFIALEMVERRIRFVWDLGGGAGSVTNQLEIKSGDLKDNKFWYTITIDRHSNVAQLRVMPSIPPENFRTTTPYNASDAGFGRLDLNQGDLLWVGGLPESSPGTRPVPPSLLARTTGLNGCIHKVVLDGRPIGLWNYHSEVSGRCNACIEGVEEIADGSSYWFNGDGYAVLRQASSSPYNRNVMSVSLKFATLDENALLFLAVNKQGTQHISLSLVGGRVVLRIKYGGESRLEITSKKKYNTRKEINIEAIRTFDRKKKLETGSLKVGTESMRGAPVPQPTLDALPDLSDAKFVVGGIPPGFHSRSIAWDLPGPYLGCMSDLQITQQGYNPLHGDFYGVEASCLDSRLKMAGFHGKGHLQIDSQPLTKTTNFGMVFRTNMPDAFILLATKQGTSGQGGYYSASLLGGKLEVRVDAGYGEIALLSDASLDDGRFHTFSVIKSGRRLELRVDDAVQSHSQLPEGGMKVKTIGPGGTFLGGLPRGMNASHMMASTQPLVGTIKDFIFNETLVYFDHPVSFEDVAIGRQGPDLGVFNTSEKSPTVTMTPREIPTRNECHKVPSYTLEPGAVKFGDLPHSHIQVNFRKRSVLTKDFTLDLDLRTFYPDGLLIFIPGNRVKKGHYILVMLENGQPKVIVRNSRRSFPLVMKTILNDGSWHHLTLSKVDRQLTLSVDGDAKLGPLKYPKKLNVGNTMFLGGIPKSGVVLPENIVKDERFKGCGRNLLVNKQQQDLVGEKTRQHGIGQCFPHVEQGSYFPGDAYAVYKNEFIVGSLLDMELWFRTSELTGVLLSVSEPRGYPALSLELNHGKVVMTVDIGDGKPFHVNSTFSSQYAVCDNQWHHVQALFVNDELTLRVDKNAVKYGHPNNGHLKEASTNSPLYVGGLPDSAPQGTLQTRENFKGCIRNVIIEGKRIDWTDMDALHNILLSSCPTSS